MANTISLTKNTDGSVSFLCSGEEEIVIASPIQLFVDNNSISFRVESEVRAMKLSDSITIGGVLFSGTLAQLKTAVENILPGSAPATALPTETVATYSAMQTSITADPTTKRDFFVSGEGQWYRYDGTNSIPFNGSIIYPERFGFSPSASASVNSDALQAALDLGGTIVIKPGNYSVSKTHQIGDNTTLIFSPGVTLTKAKPNDGVMTYLFVNKAASISGRNKNIKIIGNGLTLVFGSSVQAGGTISIPYMNAQFSFYKVDNIEISGLYCNETGNTWNQYFLALMDCSYGEIFNIDINYPKDGIDIIGCNNIHVHDIKTSCDDDSLFIGIGWPQFCPIVKDTYKILIERWTDIERTGATGRTIRFIATAWDDWTNGRSYGPRDYCLNGGKIYRCANTTGFKTASVAPTHSNGDVTGADGIIWRWIADGSFYSTNISDVTIKDFASTSSRGFIWMYQESSAVEPTHKSYIDNIYLDNASWLPPQSIDPSFKSFLSMQAYAKKIFIKNSKADLNNYTATNPGYGAYFFSSDILTYNGSNRPMSIDLLEVNNCEVDSSGSGCFIVNNTNTSFTSKKVRVINSLIKAKQNNAFAFNPIMIYSATQWNTIELINSEFSNTERLFMIQGASSGTWNIRANGCIFTTPKYVGVAGPAGTTVNFSLTNCYFDNPAQQIFYGASSTFGSFNIYTSGSQGTVVDGKAYPAANIDYLNFLKLDLPVGKISYSNKITAAGTTGNQTINKRTGTVNIAAPGTSVTVTNSLVSTTSIVYAVIRTNDSTAVIKNVVCSNGSFVINLNAAATAETSIGFIVFN
jgi:hypothetical protein